MQVNDPSLIRLFRLSNELAASYRGTAEELGGVWCYCCSNPDCARPSDFVRRCRTEGNQVVSRFHINTFDSLMSAQDYVNFSRYDAGCTLLL